MNSVDGETADHLDADGNERPVPRRKILSDTRIMIGIIIGSFSAAKWSSVDPILEPELRSKVFSYAV